MFSKTVYYSILFIYLPNECARMVVQQRENEKWSFLVLGLVMRMAANEKICPSSSLFISTPYERYHVIIMYPQKFEV